MTFVNNIDPVIFSYGFFSLRWYGIFFLIGIVLNYLLLIWAFKKNKYKISDLESLVVYLFFGLILGARFGHIIFYEPAYYFAHPENILKIWNGGLASHGAAIGLLIAYALWTFIHKIKFSKYVDILALGIPITAMFVRIGNFFNSEIVGIKSGGDFGVIFKRLGEDFPRHPAQLYEAVLNLAIFLFLFFVYKKYYKKTPPLFYLFSYLFFYFGGRFLIEFKKDLHGLPESFPLSTGQVLSLVPVGLSVVYFLWIFLKRRKGK
ncbi:MAG: prolipoprotein diacylglyceryl transferase [Candidatus Gracilibacteria bacterium]|nr:prolipoprotein diacylglyceryl transferase [Candidatus Gracilibacteria bacterium]